MTTTTDEPHTTHALLKNNSLVLHTHESCWPAVHSWLPLSAQAVPAAVRRSASITVRPAASAALPVPATPSTLRLGSVSVWVHDADEHALLTGSTPTRGTVELANHGAQLEIDAEAGESSAADVYSMLTISAALLLGRMGDTLIHAGAVVAPGGGGWLVVGDAQSGKSTTCVSLAHAGCALLSDDQVALIPREDKISIEGWLRPLHLDTGWDQGLPRGERRTIDPADLGPAYRQGETTAAGLLLTSVVPEQPTTVTPVSPGDAFVNILRQSPWLLADRRAARSVVQLLTDVAHLPRVALRLGLDTFGRPERLWKMLGPVLD